MEHGRKKDQYILNNSSYTQKIFCYNSCIFLLMFIGVGDQINIFLQKLSKLFLKHIEQS